ncbi:MAG: hypothetical protein ACR2JG_00395 [Geodermatophilaceae bacterium]
MAEGAPSWSPLILRAQLRTPVLNGHAKNDTVVFPSQTRTLCTSAFPKLPHGLSCRR